MGERAVLFTFGHEAQEVTISEKLMGGQMYNEGTFQERLGVVTCMLG